MAVGFLGIFGRPARDTPFEQDRMCRISMAQELYALNASEMREQIDRSPRIERWLQSRRSDAEIVEELYLTALARPPAAQEKQVAIEYLGKEPKARRQALQDLMWAVLNTKEFLFNR
jgi:hypothetical protein